MHRVATFCRGRIAFTRARWVLYVKEGIEQLEVEQLNETCLWAGVL